jgi:hypothetical protein
MSCIFCKNDSSSSVSIEHIIPESLGNTEYFLPAGIVYDVCEYYIVVIIFGDEYVLNLGGRELDDYKKWLVKNNNKCFLYTNKNA